MDGGLDGLKEVERDLQEGRNGEPAMYKGRGQGEVRRGVEVN